ncbi:Uncharacterised protein [Pragia fontium]|nr:Uncharacterised protein [Pragia fontium]
MLKKCLILLSLVYCSFSYAMQFPATMKNAQKPPSEATIN